MVTILMTNTKKFFGGTKKILRWRIRILTQRRCQTLKELSDSLSVEESTVTKCLKLMRLILKLGNKLPHDLKERDIQRWL